MTPTLQVLEGHCLEQLQTLPDASVQCCVTSPPYWGLRDYATPPVHFPSVTFPPVAGLPSLEVPPWDGELGQEPDPWAFVGHLVQVFREVRRVLKDDGVLWLNLGDSYARDSKKGGSGTNNGRNIHAMGYRPKKAIPDGLKEKDLVGIPWRAALALQADGWTLRSDVIWHKPNVMPESAKDRLTRAHEYLFLFSKRPEYLFNADAIKEKAISAREAKYDNGKNGHGGGESHAGQGSSTRNFGSNPELRIRRTVWTIATAPYTGAHFAPFPPALVEPCILAGSSRGDVVLDPFGGTGTTGKVAIEHGRSAILVELGTHFHPLISDRCTVTPFLNLA